jgi:hypothetical protein
MRRRQKSDFNEQRSEKRLMPGFSSQRGEMSWIAQRQQKKVSLIIVRNANFNRRELQPKKKLKHKNVLFAREDKTKSP